MYIIPLNYASREAKGGDDLGVGLIGITISKQSMVMGEFIKQKHHGISE